MTRGRSGAAGSPTVFVTALTVTALVVIAFFGYQASAADDRPLASAQPNVPAPDEDEDGQSEDAADAEEDAEDEGPLLPADSGEGTRVVYSLGERHVWLVSTAEDGLGEEILADYEVYPSSVDPEPGAYEVTSRTGQLTGSDGLPIQHSMVFQAPPEDVVFGFSTALDGSIPDPDSDTRTGGIRQQEEHGEAMWQFAPVGTPVVVVP